jgi:hypothetical protein
MSAVTFGDAAAYLGHKSRSTLYRLKRAGFLSDYLRPGGKGGAQLLELTPEGLPTLRAYCRGILLARIDSPLWRAEPEPEPPAPPDDPLGFWREWGRVAGPDDPPLSGDEAEEHAAAMAWHMTEPPIPQRPAPDRFRFWLWEVEHQAADSRRDVAAGARWDQARWDAANVQCLLDDLPCPVGAGMLREQLEASRVPAELVETVREALAAFEAEVAE